MCRAYGDDNTGGRGDSRKDKEMKWESIDREKVGYCGKEISEDIELYNEEIET